MAKSKNITTRIIKAFESIGKARNQTNINPDTHNNAGYFISHSNDMRGFKTLVNNSTVLPQCICAYKNNIAGFGLGIRYKENIPETEEMKAEWDKINSVIKYLNLESDTKNVFENVIEAREIYGIAFVEVIRNNAGEVAGIEFIKATPSIDKTHPLAPYIEIDYELGKRPKQFRKYRQQLDGTTVYFKEIGDPRIMDNRTGEYVEDVPIEYQANEILEFAIGVEPYGEVRWLGQLLNVDGSRRAENLNNNYFRKGRHTPMLIAVNGGSLNDKSWDELQRYMNDIEGENGQHGFIVLESENLGNGTGMDDAKPPTVEIKDLAGMLQKDELFQSYLDNGRRKVQSSFLLPDLYVGYTTDFNRATAQMAMEVTEEQVFQPERKNLAWIINNKLLADYNFKYVEVYFLEPNTTNPDDIMKILNITERAGGLTPNKAKEFTYKIFGEVAENYDGEWGDIPLAYTRLTGQTPADTDLKLNLSNQIQKSARRNDEISCILKEIRSFLANHKGEI